MKFRAITIIPFAAALLAAGCIQEQQETKAEKTAHYFNSKMNVGPVLFEWSDSDVISVYDGTSKGQTLSNSNKTSSTSARFTGYAYDADPYFAAYSPVGAVTWKEGGSPIAEFNLPDVQVVPENNAAYAREAVSAVATAKKGVTAMDFTPAPALLSFKVGAEGPFVSSIELKSLSGKALAGDFTAAIGGDGKTVTTFGAGAASSVTLKSFDGECPFNEGTYYMAFAPGEYPDGDLELTIKYTNGKNAADTLSKVPALTSGSVFEYGTLPEYVAPVDPDDDDDDPVGPGQIMNKYDIYLLIGQSNMAGRGVLTEADKKETVEGVYLLDSYMSGFSGEYTAFTGSKNYEEKPVPATHPFNQYSTIRKNLATQQMNPGYGFATTVRDYNKARGYTRPILIVCNPRGGTSITEWAKGKEYYNEAVRRTKEAMKYGTLKGILWHQGCSDGSRVNSYMGLLNTMVTNLRTDLGAGNVAFVAGELAYWRSSSPVFNEMIQTIESNISNSGWVSAKDCGALKPESLNTDSPDPHFSREGQILLGSRYGEKIIEMVYKEKEPSTLKLTSQAEIKDISNSGDTFEATIESNAPWTVSIKSGATAAVTLLSSGGNKNGTFSFKVGANMDHSEKTATIVVCCEGCDPVEITLTQKAASSFMVVFPEAPMVDASVFNSLHESSRWFKVASDKAWTAKVGSETTAEDVTITTASGTGNLDKFEVTVAKQNTDWNNRKKVVIEFTLSDKSVEKVTMYQEKASVLALEFRDQDNKTMKWPFKEDIPSEAVTISGGDSRSLSCGGYVFPCYGVTCVCKESNYGWRIGTGVGSYFETPVIAGKTLKKIYLFEHNGKALKFSDSKGTSITATATPATAADKLIEYTLSNPSADTAYRVITTNGTLRIYYIRLVYE